MWDENVLLLVILSFGPARKQKGILEGCWERGISHNIEHLILLGKLI